MATRKTSKAVRDRIIAPVATGTLKRGGSASRPRVEVVTRSAKLASKDHSRGIHTEHHGRAGAEKYQSGTAKGTTSTSFLFGRAKGIPGQTHEQLRDAGVLK